MAKFRGCALLLLTISCSHPGMRGPASIDECASLYKRAPSLSSEESLFRSLVKSNSPVSYHINFDRLKKAVSELESRYPNQLRTSVIGTYDGEPIYRVDIPGWGSGSKKKVIVSAGVHGNESAGVATILNFIDRNIYVNGVRNNFDIVLVPYLNPGGLKNNVRRLNNNIDLNRSFSPKDAQGPTKVLRESLQGERFDMALDLHEAPFRTKFFVIKAAEDDGGIARAALADVPQDYLYTSATGSYPYGIPSATNPNKVAYNLSSPGESVSFNKGTLKAFYTDELKTPKAYTLEAPGKFALERKIEIYTEMVEGFLEQLLRNSH